MESQYGLVECWVESVVSGDVQMRVFGIDDGVDPLQRLLSHGDEIGRREAPVKGECHRGPRLTGRKNGLTVYHAGGPFGGHQCVEGTDKGFPSGQLKFKSPH